MGCSLLCGDLAVSIDRDGAIIPRTDCRLAAQWFDLAASGKADDKADDKADQLCLVNGQPASTGEGITEAARLIRHSTLPLIGGLADQGLDGQRAAFELARQIGAIIDWRSGPTAKALFDARQKFGDVSCSFGEIGNRADLVVFWFADPAISHPRFAARFAPRHTCIDNRVTETGRTTQQFMLLENSGGTDAARVVQQRLDHVSRPGTNQASAADLAKLESLAEQIKQSQYAVFVFDETLCERFGVTAVSSLFRLIRAANDGTRHCRQVHLSRNANSVGIENALTWLTGYPFGVGFRERRPIFRPAEFTASKLLKTGQIDLVIQIGCLDPGSKRISPAPSTDNTTRIVLAADTSSEKYDAAVAFTIARPGIECSDVALRSDGMPLRLPKLLIQSSLPTCSHLIHHIRTAIDPSLGPIV